MSVFFFFFFSLTLTNQRREESSGERPARDSPTPSATLTPGFGVHGRSALITTKNLFPTPLLLRLHPVWSPPDSRGHGGEARRSCALCRDQTAAEAERI